MKHRNRIIAALALGVSLFPLQTHAIFGSGVVFDPTNFAQNLVIAIRSVQQVNNQIQQLDHEVLMLANQAEDLQSLPFSVQSEINGKLAQIEGLIASANSIAYSVSEMEAAYLANFPEEYASLSNSETIQAARSQWDMTRKAYHDALMVQAEITDHVASDRVTLNQLVSQSQSATGNLQAAQAGNQLVALQTKQLMQNQLLVASQYRAEALERANVTAARARSDSRFSNFIGAGTAYTP